MSQRAWAVCVTAAAIAFVMASALPDPTRWVAGDAHVDAYGTAWFYHYIGEALAGRQSYTHTDLLFHPWGKDVLSHTGANLLDGVLARPLLASLGPVLGYNAWIVVILVGNAVAGARLAAALGVSAGRRWLGGLSLVLAPYVLLELAFGRPTQAILVFPALFVAALARVFAPRPDDTTATLLRQAALGGLWLAASGYMYWFHGLALAGCAAAAGVARLAVGPERLRVASGLAVAATVAVVLVLPVVLPLLGAAGRGEVPGLLAWDGDGPLAPLALRTVEGDPEGVWILAPGRFGAGSLIDEGGLRFVPGVPPLLALPTILAVLGLARLRSLWLVAWLLAATWLACGPALLVGDRVFPNTPYLALMGALPFLRRWWWPGRAVSAATVLIAALAPVALEAVRDGRWARALGLAVGVGLALSAAVVDLAPLHRWDGASSAALECLARAPAGAVIDVPWELDQKHVWLQVRHRHPILGGMLTTKEAFVPGPLLELRERNRLVAMLEDLGRRRYNVSLDVSQADRRELLDLGYRYILGRSDGFLRPRLVDGADTLVSDWPRARRLIEKAMGAPPFFEDESYAVWLVGPPDASLASLRLVPGCGG